MPQIVSFWQKLFRILLPPWLGDVELQDRRHDSCHAEAHVQSASQMPVCDSYVAHTPNNLVLAIRRSRAGRRGELTLIFLSMWVTHANPAELEQAYTFARS